MPVRLKGLDFLNIKSIVASPYFGMENNYHVAYMDSEGIVFLTEVEIALGEFNEGLTMSPFVPQVKLIDLYGAENMESLGQSLNREVQNELFLVGLRNPGPGRAPTIWLKHYTKGILTVDEVDDDEDGKTAKPSKSGR